MVAQNLLIALSGFVKLSVWTLLSPPSDTGSIGDAGVSFLVRVIN